MGNIYYLISPKSERVLETDKRFAVVDGDGHITLRIQPEDTPYDREAFTPEEAIALLQWVQTYGGPGMKWSVDAAVKGDEWWIDWTEDDLYELMREEDPGEAVVVRREVMVQVSEPIAPHEVGSLVVADASGRVRLATPGEFIVGQVMKVLDDVDERGRHLVVVDMFSEPKNLDGA